MTRWLAVAAAAAITLCAAGSPAVAYPQLLGREATCTGCHLSPAGGGPLGENGLAVAEAISRWGTAAEFFYGKVHAPSWLMLGGDLRGASGYVQTPEKLLASFPMQIEGWGRATLGPRLSLYVNLGSRASQVGHESTTFAWSREHYLMWQQHPGDSSGLYLRAGRFMPVFGLRLAEHPTYVRRWGGTPLYGETYGIAAEYVAPSYEVHATGFIRDPILDTPEHSSGGAVLGEVRVRARLSLGAEAMYTSSEGEKKYRIGALARWQLESPELLLQFEGQFMNQLIEPRGAPKQIIAEVLASRFVTGAVLLDLGLGFFDENLQISGLHREAVDLNVHWFATSHVETIFTGRLETLDLGGGGPNSGYALIQLHSRL